MKTSKDTDTGSGVQNCDKSDIEISNNALRHFDDQRHLLGLNP